MSACSHICAVDESVKITKLIEARARTSSHLLMHSRSLSTSKTSWTWVGAWRDWGKAGYSSSARGESLRGSLQLGGGAPRVSWARHYLLAPHCLPYSHT